MSNRRAIVDEILGEIFQLLEQQVWAREIGIAATKTEEYQRRAKRIDQLAQRLVPPKYARGEDLERRV